MAEKPVVIYEKKLNGRVVVMTMNRPEAMNALNNELSDAVYDGFEQFRDDDEAWVLILTGVGDRAFCAGADLKQSAQRSAGGGQAPPPRRSTRLHLPYPLSDFLELWKPTIAAVNGYAIAGGFNLAMQCDIRIAAEHAEFGVAEVRWNLAAGWAHSITRQMHLQHALELMLWGDRRISAQRAYEMGWGNRVVPKERLMDEAMEWAERMLSLAPRAVRDLKEIIYRGFYVSPMEMGSFARAIDQNLSGMEDTREGPRAFTEKRKPQFKNK